MTRPTQTQLDIESACDESLDALNLSLEAEEAQDLAREAADAPATIAATPPNERVLIYWLLRGYRAFNKAAWESGEFESEFWDAAVCLLANYGFDPCVTAAKRLLEQGDGEKWRGPME